MDLKSVWFQVSYFRYLTIPSPWLRCPIHWGRLKIFETTICFLKADPDHWSREQPAPRVQGVELRHRERQVPREGIRTLGLLSGFEDHPPRLGKPEPDPISEKSSVSWSMLEFRPIREPLLSHVTALNGWNLQIGQIQHNLRSMFGYRTGSSSSFSNPSHL